MNVKVFVSSTWEDLEPERKAVERVVHRMAELEFSGMEHFGSSPRSARDESLEKVDAADVYVGVFGGRYGSGITEEEYRRARERDLPCFLYFKTEASIPEEQRDKEPERIARRAAFHAELRDSREGHLSSSFSSPDDLAAQVGPDLHNWLFHKRLTPALTAAAQQGRFPEIRDIVERTRDREALRLALEGAGVAVGDDLVDGLLALGNPAILQIFVKATAKLPADYDTRFRNYFVEYLGTAKKPVPFGGRLKTLEELDAWLIDEASPPYLLLTADAGRGKSALLVHWGRRLLTRENLTVIHVPVSIRFRTNLAAVVFATLTAQLAEAHGEEVPTDVNTSVEVWRGLVSDYLQRPLPDDRRLVVILDGLDEAADWAAGADLFPFEPPPGLRLVVSARHISEAPDAEAWRRLLGWDDPGLARALALAPLDREGVADVLQRMGFPLDELGKRVDVVAELHRLSDGDPLLVRLYVDDLWKRGRDAAGLRPEDLKSIRPGLEGYFDRWWKDQRTLWGDDAPLQEKGVQTVLSILTCAFGPLTRDDLLAVAPPESGLNSWTLEDALRPLARFIVGDGTESGYVLSHPRFALYLHARLNQQERRAWDDRFTGWGRSELKQLTERTLAPDKASAYLVQYLGAHLERAGAPLEDFLALVSEGWKLAWAAREGSYSGFVSDVDRAWRFAAEADRKAVEAGLPAPHLHDEIYLALCRASVQSLARRIPPVLLDRLVESGVWKPQQALTYAQQFTDPAQRAGALSLVARHLPEKQRKQAEEEALALALSIRNDLDRAIVLANLLKILSPPPIQAFVEAVEAPKHPFKRELFLEAARALSRRSETKNPEAVLLALQPHMDAELFADLQELLQSEKTGPAEARDSSKPAQALQGREIEETLKSLSGMPSYQRTVPARQVVLSLALSGQPEAALTSLENILDASDRVKVLADLHGSLPEEIWIRMVRDLLSRFRPDPMGKFTAALQDVVQHFSDPLLREAMSILTRIGDLGPRATARLMLGLQEPATEPDPTLERLIEDMRSLPREDRVALVLLILFGPPSLQSRLMPDLLDSMPLDGTAGYCFMIELAEKLPEPDGRNMTQVAWNHLLQLGDASFLKEISQAETPPPPFVRSRISHARLAKVAQELGPRSRLRALAWLLYLLPPTERRQKALELIKLELIKEAASLTVSVDAVRLALGHLSREVPQALLSDWLCLQGEKERAKAIVILAPYLNPERLQEALRVARAFEGPQHQALALAGLLPYLPSSDQRQVVRDAFSEGSCSHWIEALSEHLLASDLLLHSQTEDLVSILRRELTPDGFAHLLGSLEDLEDAFFLLWKVSPAAAVFDRSSLCRNIQDLLRPGRPFERPNLLMDLAVLAPVLAALGAQDSIPRIKAAVEAACELFP